MALAFAAAALVIVVLMGESGSEQGFVSPNVRAVALSKPRGVVSRAAETLDAETVGDKGAIVETEEFDGDLEKAEERRLLAKVRKYLKPQPKPKTFPEEAYLDYNYKTEPSQAWFDRRWIDRHKVNMHIMDMFKKPVSFFPPDLRPGDSIRVVYLDATPVGEGWVPAPAIPTKQQMKEVVVDGTVMNIGGDYHARTITIRTMVGRSTEESGYELCFPMHSPLVTRIDLLRRGYIGKNKNAYFLRGLVGKKNAIPLDEERTKIDRLYNVMTEEGRAHEIPEPEYPQKEDDRYPLPIWKQDQEDWDESLYDPDLVDQRTEYERRVIGKYKKRVSRTGKYGWR